MRKNQLNKIKSIIAAGIILSLSACSTMYSKLPTSGPSSDIIVEQKNDINNLVKIIDLDDKAMQSIATKKSSTNFSTIFGTSKFVANKVGPGDILEINIWEAPPSILFSSASAISPSGLSSSAHSTTLPEQMISEDGTISVPFVGLIFVNGKTPQQIASLIEKKLENKANKPQVLIKVKLNTTSNITIIGEVSQSIRMPLTAKGERILDAIAAAGGVKQSVNKISIQLARGSTVKDMPLDRIINDPSQNIYLRSDDIITALFAPKSFIALGAISKNEEINFEAQGISLAQALGRIGGLQDSRSDAQGVFIFRNEETIKVDSENNGATTEAKLPVIYKINLKDPKSFFLAQNFPIHDKDVMYIANAPAAELQKFLNILTSSIYSASALVNLPSK